MRALIATRNDGNLNARWASLRPHCLQQRNVAARLLRLGSPKWLSPEEAWYLSPVSAKPLIATTESGKL